jgi:cardiolipin synthase
VRTRVLLDRVGARRIDSDLVEVMLEAGCDVQWFLPADGDAPLADAAHRTHRKVLVCDNEVVFTGGVGIAEEWTGNARNPGEWRDTHFRVRGPAVDGLRSAFLRDWIESATPSSSLEWMISAPWSQSGDPRSRCCGTRTRADAALPH